MSKTINIPLSELKFGHEATPSLNARKTGRDQDIDTLKASLVAHQLIEALIVRQIDGENYVVNGNRRLLAYRELAEAGEVSDDFAIKCDVDEDGLFDIETSLVTGIENVPLHVADAHEVFRELADKGLSEGEIADRFGVDTLRIKRSLALGRLSPVILQAWRDNEIHSDDVQAFTLATSIEDQERVYKSLKRAGTLWQHYIRREFGAGNGEAARLLQFVGNDDFVAAGGTVVEDLFTDQPAISDPALVAKLADKKLRAKCADLIEAGWSWAELANELPDGWSWKWEKLKTNKSKATKKHKEASGCVVYLNSAGKLEITYGVVKPTPAKEKAAGASSKKKAPTISNALAHRLSVQATHATREALTAEPRLGLVALLAGFHVSSHYGPVKVQTTGLTGHSIDHSDTFAAVFERLSKATDEELFAIAAGIAGQALDLQVQEAARTAFGNVGGELAAAIDAEALGGALARTFDAADYFGAVSKPLILAAIAEAVGDEESEKQAKAKKPDLVEYATKNVPGTGWLPKELRTANYSGPGTDQKQLKKAA